jgi:hypothetical protein
MVLQEPVKQLYFKNVEHDHPLMVCSHKGVLIFDFFMHLLLLYITQLLINKTEHYDFKVARYYCITMAAVILIMTLCAYLGGLHKGFLLGFSAYGFTRVFLFVVYIILGLILIGVRLISRSFEWGWMNQPDNISHWLKVLILNGYQAGGALLVVGFSMSLTHLCYKLGKKDQKENYIVSKSWHGLNDSKEFQIQVTSNSVSYDKNLELTAM